MLYTIERPTHTATQPDTLRHAPANASTSDHTVHSRWSAELQSPCQCAHHDPRHVTRQQLTCAPLVLRHGRTPRAWQAYRAAAQP